MMTSIHPVLVTLFASRIVTSFLLLAVSLSTLSLKPALGSIQLQESSTLITITTPRRGLILALLSLISVSFFSDGLTLIVHSVISKIWQGTPNLGLSLWRSKWSGLDIEAVIGLFSSTLLSSVAVWKEYHKIAVWTTWRPKLWAIVALAGSSIELWCLFASDFHYRKGLLENY